MTGSYVIRLVILVSATFFLVQLLVEALVAWIGPGAIRRTEGMRPRLAARWLLTLRLLPTAFSSMVVILLCIPSYLRFEPRVAEEEVGILCLAAASLGVAVVAASIHRIFSAWIRTAVYLRRCRGVESCIEGEAVWVIPQNAGVTLAGIMRPKFLISEAAVRQLSQDQLAVALRHERAHHDSLDNLKRFLILLTPSIFPGVRRLEKAWSDAAEWAADDRAVAGNSDRSLALADALVCVARLRSGTEIPPLFASLIEPGENLSVRVERLLQSAPTAKSNFRPASFAISIALLLVVAMAINTGALRIVHVLLEHLLD